MTITELQKEIHDIARSKGWWDDPRNIGELIALCHSELSEALEEIRTRISPSLITPSITIHPDTELVKPLGFPIELADVIIRVLDIAGGLGIDMEQAIHIKMAYNRTREYKHGKKF